MSLNRKAGPCYQHCVQLGCTGKVPRAPTLGGSLPGSVQTSLLGFQPHHPCSWGQDLGSGQWHVPAQRCSPGSRKWQGPASRVGGSDLSFAHLQGVRRRECGRWGAWAWPACWPATAGGQGALSTRVAGEAGLMLLKDQSQPEEVRQTHTHPHR